MVRRDSRLPTGFLTGMCLYMDPQSWLREMVIPFGAKNGPN